MRLVRVAGRMFSARLSGGGMEMFAAEFVPVRHLCDRLIWSHDGSCDSKYAAENAAPYLKLPYV